MGASIPEPYLFIVDVYLHLHHMILNQYIADIQGNLASCPRMSGIDHRNKLLETIKVLYCESVKAVRMIKIIVSEVGQQVITRKAIRIV